MPNGTTAAVTEAARLDEIGFPEFTAKLVTDVFDSLVAANIRQTQSYIELVQAVGKSLTAYINDTKDDISGEEVLQLLAAIQPPDDATSDEPTKIKEGATLKKEDAQIVNEAIELPDGAGVDGGDNKIADEGNDTQIDKALYNKILEAAARRLSASKYGLLKEMVKQGILRLVVENGIIETRLTFTTYGSTFYQKNASKFHRDSFRIRAKARTGGLLSPFVKASASTSYTNINIRTAKESHRDVSGSRVQIFGRVEINFKTDYLPLPGQ